MTTTINASTSSGLVVSPDNSGNIVLQYNGVAAPAFSVYETATQSFSSSTWTKVAFDTKEYDTNTNFSVANSRFTPTVGGYYQINATADCDAGSSANNLQRGVLAIYKNGTLYKCGGVAWSLANGNRELSTNVASVVFCNGTTDYVEIYIYGIASTNINTGGGAVYTWMNGCLLRGA